MSMDTFSFCLKNRFVRLENGACIEPGIDHLCHLHENHLGNLSPVSLIFRPPSEKKEFRIRVLSGFMGDG
jgi:hypothetical protein